MSRNRAEDLTCLYKPSPDGPTFGSESFRNRSTVITSVYPLSTQVAMDAAILLYDLRGVSVDVIPSDEAGQVKLGKQAVDLSAGHSVGLKITLPRGMSPHAFSGRVEETRRLLASGSTAETAVGRAYRAAQTLEREGRQKDLAGWRALYGEKVSAIVAQAGAEVDARVAAARPALEAAAARRRLPLRVVRR